MPLVCSDNIDAINRVIFLYFFYKSIGQIRAVCLPEQIENFIDSKTIRKYLFMKQYMLYCNKVFGTGMDVSKFQNTMRGTTITGCWLALKIKLILHPYTL